MRSLISALFFMLALSACDNELNLISRDFSVSLKSIDGGAAAVGKAVNCTFSVNGLDPDNGRSYEPEDVRCQRNGDKG